jgi:hypothetical protein
MADGTTQVVVGASTTRRLRDAWDDRAAEAGGWEDSPLARRFEQTLQEMFAATYESLAASLAYFGFLGRPGFWHGCTTASALIGTILGAALAGKPSDVFGRRKTLFGLAVLYFVSAVWRLRNH